MKIILSREAKNDMDSIMNYLSKKSIKAALKNDKNILLSIHNPKLFPYIGRFITELSNTNIRELIYKDYRIVYEIKEPNIIYIHFIVHCKRQFTSFYNDYIKNNF